LAVDDDPALTRAYTAVLHRYGFVVSVANGGAEGIRMCSQRQQHLSLVILDVQMPQISGVEVFRAIRERTSELPVLFASGYPAGHELQAILRGARVDLIAKPFTLRSLLQRIDHLLGAEGGSARGPAPAQP
jgi:two-component system NtrC family sensor kinase